MGIEIKGGALVPEDTEEDFNTPAAIEAEPLRHARNPRCPPIREPQSLELEKLLSERTLLMHQLNENERQIMQIVHDLNWRKI